jgi:hypothetical protein
MKITFNESLFKVGCRLKNDPFDFTCTANNPPGYYYKPHNPIKIKDFSSYIEEGNPATVSEIPDYAVFSKTNGTFIWRDIYTYGFADTDGVGVDYPFLNGTHYPYGNFVFRIIPEGTNYIESDLIYSAGTMESKLRCTICK